MPMWDYSCDIETGLPPPQASECCSRVFQQVHVKRPAPFQRDKTDQETKPENSTNLIVITPIPLRRTPTN